MIDSPALLVAFVAWSVLCFVFGIVASDYVRYLRRAKGWWSGSDSGSGSFPMGGSTLPSGDWGSSAWETLPLEGFESAWGEQYRSFQDTHVDSPATPLPLGDNRPTEEDTHVLVASVLSVPDVLSVSDLTSEERERGFVWSAESGSDWQALAAVVHRDKPRRQHLPGLPVMREASEPLGLDSDSHSWGKGCAVCQNAYWCDCSKGGE